MTVKSSEVRELQDLIELGDAVSAALFAGAPVVTLKRKTEREYKLALSVMLEEGLSVTEERYAGGGGVLHIRKGALSVDEKPRAPKAREGVTR